MFGTYKLTEAGIRGMMFFMLEQGLDQEWFAPLVFRDDNVPDPYSNTHGWLGGIPGMRERTGDQEYQKIRAFEQTLRQRDFECNIPIPKKDWIKNRFKQIQKRLMDQTQIIRGHPGDLIQALIAAGESTAIGKDGQYFFDDDHESGKSGAQSNDIEVTVVDEDAPTKAEMKAAIMAGVAQLLGFKDDQGNFINLSANDFMVGTSLAMYPTLLETLGLITEVGGNTDIIRMKNQAFTLTPQLLPSVTGSKIYLFRRRQAGLGSCFILDVAIPVEPVILGPESEHCKKHDEVLIKASGTYNAGYGDWTDACLVTLAEAG